MPSGRLIPASPAGTFARAIALHDPWTPEFSGLERYDQLRKDPKGAVLMAMVLTR